MRPADQFAHVSADVARVHARGGGCWLPDPGTFEIVADGAGSPVAATFEQDGRRLTVPWGAVESIEQDQGPAT